MRRFRTKVDFFGGVRRVVRDIGAGDGVMRQGVRNVGGAMSFGGLIQEVEVRTARPLYRASEHFFEASSRKLFTERRRLREQTHLVWMR
jgi:hypothetical protein